MSGGDRVVFMLKNVLRSPLWRTDINRFSCIRAFSSAKGKNVHKVVMPKFSTVTHLSTLLKQPIVKVQKTMENMGFSQTDWDFIVDDESAVLIADELGITAEINENHGEDLYPQNVSPEKYSQLPARPPVIALMGHVDHGKTTLLDYFRKSHIVDGEKGGITQHIGALLTQVNSGNGNAKQEICFLDTPGHEAFLKLRQRGANLTDLILLVVAADDSVMPQTKEAIRHAKAAGVPLVVALTKSDKPDAKPERVMADLAGAGVDVEEYGGETPCVAVSAVTGMGIDDLMAAVQAQIEVQDLRAPQKGFKTEGVIVESSVSKGVGPAATVIVKKGILRPKQVVVAGNTYCRVRQLTNERGKSLKEAGPGTPVRISGWKGISEPGDVMLEADNEAQAKRVVENRVRNLEIALEAKQVAIINENKATQAAEAEERAERDERAALGLSRDEEGASGPKVVEFVVKADVAGSAEAVADIINQLGNDEISAKVLFSAVGPVTESDIFRAETSGASIIAFSTQVPRPVERLAEQHKVPIKKYDVIYKAMEDVSGQLSSQLAPIITRKVVATMEIRAIFTITLKKRSKLEVAGVKVARGQFTTSTLIQVIRDGNLVHEGTLASIQHGKDHVTEAHKGSEYGVSFTNWNKFQEGDIVEGYEEIKTPRYI